MGLRGVVGALTSADLKATLKCLRWSVNHSYHSSTSSGIGRWGAAARAAWVVIFKPRRYLVFAPGAPYHDNFILGKVIGYHRVRPTTNLAKLSGGCALMVFKNATEFDPCLPPDLPHGLRVINRFATDIRKSRVEAVFAQVSGYTTFLDPTTHNGPAVEKSERNATHDGRVVECPLREPRPGCVYQRVIRNSDDSGNVIDLRVSVVNGTIPVVYMKRRPVANRFSNTNESVELYSPGDIFSSAEIEMICLFARRFGLDFGELDVLRDADDGRIYVVDVNNTPFGPPNGLSKSESIRAVQKIATAFGAAFLTNTPTN